MGMVTKSESEGATGKVDICISTVDKHRTVVYIN